MSETVNQEANVNAQTAGSGEASAAAAGQGSPRTFTQEELNGIVNERLKREREKYADYSALREKAAKFDEIEEKSKTELQKATERAEALQKELDGLKQAEAVRKAREKVSGETGVPASLLTGSTEEECKAQAEAIKAFANPSYPSVRDGGETAGVHSPSTKQNFVNWFNQVAN